MKISRRTMLGLAGAAALASTGIGYAGVRSLSKTDLVRATLENYLGSLPMTDDHMRAFAIKLERRNPWLFPTRKLANAATLASKTGVTDWFRQVLPDDDLGQLERFDRWVLGEFHLLTDYASRGGEEVPISFTGLEPCVNPFAKFDMEEVA